jgi:hypothetical protein
MRESRHEAATGAANESDEARARRELLERAEEVARSLRGANVDIDVTTADGREHRGRRLENITIEPRRDLISGYDPRVGAVRTFRLSRVTRMESAGRVTS